MGVIRLTKHVNASVEARTFTLTAATARRLLAETASSANGQGLRGDDGADVAAATTRDCAPGTPVLLLDGPAFSHFVLDAVQDGRLPLATQSNAAAVSGGGIGGEYAPPPCSLVAVTSALVAWLQARHHMARPLQTVLLRRCMVVTTPPSTRQ